MAKRFHCYCMLLFLCFFTCLIISCSGSGSGSGNAERPELDDYKTGDPAPMETTPEMKSIVSEGGKGDITLDDGTSAAIPELEGAWAAELKRDNADDPFKDIIEAISDETGMVSTGAMRALSISGDEDPSNLKPVITIPQRETGTVDLETINVLRVGDMFVENERVTDHAMILPVSITKNGDIRFVDPLMADGLVLTGEMAGAPVMSHAPVSGKSLAPVKYAWVGNARYILMTFQDDLNWRREPRLVRMIPDSSGDNPGYRRPATEDELEDLSKKPICNMVLLVHGHNEEEKGGIYDAPAEAPWLFTYKRRVWDIFYRDIMDDQYPTECTAFYEYIYPTYRPIFSPVPDKSGLLHETLGEAMGRLVEDEIEDNAQLGKMIDADMDFTIFVAAHSQGGLVARAGFRHLPRKFKSRLNHFVSWGSPHHGAALYSLRYALQSGHDMVIDGIRLPLQNIGNSMITGSILKNQLNTHVAIDAPGIRDMRWDASKKKLLTLLSNGEPFPEINDNTIDTIDPPLFSDNLKTFNEEPFEEKSNSDVTYTFITGTTPKTAQFDMVDTEGGWWWQYRRQQLLKLADSTGIEQGAALNRLMMTSGYQSNDGAVPLFSQGGVDIYTTVNHKAADDIDHEEFYGAEPPQRNLATMYKAKLVAGETFGLFRLDHESRECPFIETDLDTAENGDTTISGRVVHPLYEEKGEKVGGIIERIEAREDNQEGDVVKSLEFAFEPDGSFTGEGKPEGPYVVAAVFKDGSEVVNTVKYDLVFYEDGRFDWDAPEQYGTRFKAGRDKCINAVVTVYDAHVAHPEALYIIFLYPDGSAISSQDRDEPFYPENDYFYNDGQTLEIDYGICGISLWEVAPLGEYTVEVLDQNHNLLISRTFELY